MKEFFEIKEKVINLIKDKKEITSETEYKQGGVYVLYVDNFEDDKIIPFYVGQTHNFQERHKEHMKEIFALNRLTKDYYIAAIINKYFEGYYKSCKLFKYLVDKECELKDIHMVLIEECEDESKRKELEQKYINEYLAPFLGFNQMNSITLSLEKKKGYFDEIKEDIVKVRKYINYGFNVLNYILAKGIFESYEPKAFNELKELSQIKEVEETIEKNKEKTRERSVMLNYVGNYSSDSLDECEKVCIKYINSFFESNGLKSDDKKKQIIRGLIYNQEKDIKEVKQYIERFSKGSKEDIFSLVLENTNKKEIERIKNKVTRYLKELPKNENEIIDLRKIIFKDIVPEREYKSYPLKDLFKEKTLDIKQIGEDNILYINIEFSNHGRRRMLDDYPYPVKVDYAFYKGAKKEKKTYYINNEFTDFFENGDYYVIERSMYVFGRQDPFKIGKRTGKEGYVGTSISTSMEYYNGINEYTLQGKETKQFFEVLKEIEKLIDEKTKIVYTSGCKSIIKDWKESTFYEEGILLRKIIRTV